MQQAVQEEHETITMFYGEEIAEDEAQALGEQIQAAFPDREVQVYDGGQPLYYYIFRVE